MHQQFKPKPTKKTKLYELELRKRTSAHPEI